LKTWHKYSMMAGIVVLASLWTAQAVAGRQGDLTEITALLKVNNRFSALKKAEQAHQRYPDAPAFQYYIKKLNKDLYGESRPGLLGKSPQPAALAKEKTQASSQAAGGGRAVASRPAKIVAEVQVEMPGVTYAPFAWGLIIISSLVLLSIVLRRQRKPQLVLQTARQHLQQNQKQDQLIILDDMVSEELHPDVERMLHSRRAEKVRRRLRRAYTIGRRKEKKKES